MFACTLGCTVGTAFAHVPALEPSEFAPGVAVPIGGPEVSRAVYGYLAPGHGSDMYSFTVSENVTRTIGIIVPAYDGHAEFRPTLSVVAPGEEPVTIPDPEATPRETEWEPFSLTRFWKGGEAEVSLEPGRTYTLKVSPGAEAQNGRYVLVFGGPEEFEREDISATARELPVIWFGAYGGAPFHWNWLALIPLGVVALLLVALVGGVVTLVRRRG